MNKFLAELMKRAAPSQEWPELERALGTLSAEMPAEVAAMKDRKIRPMGGLERLVNGIVRPGMGATTSPFGNISYDREALQAAGINPEDALAHELVHVRQIDRGGSPLRALGRTLTGNASAPYGQRDFEREALEVEMSKMGRRKRTEDIPLGGSK